MTGEEHYAKAETCLIASDSQQDPHYAMLEAAHAQVHATLALVKATASVAAGQKAFLDACNGDYPPHITVRQA